MAGKRSPTSHRTPAQIREHYKEYQGTPEQIKNRAQRNSARAAMAKKHGKAAIEGKDVDHKRMIKNGGGNGSSNLRLQSVRKNRGWERDR